MLVFSMQPLRLSPAYTRYQDENVNEGRENTMIQNQDISFLCQCSILFRTSLGNSKHIMGFLAFTFYTCEKYKLYRDIGVWNSNKKLRQWGKGKRICDPLHNNKIFPDLCPQLFFEVNTTRKNIPKR